MLRSCHYANEQWGAQLNMLMHTLTCIYSPNEWMEYLRICDARDCERKTTTVFGLCLFERRREQKIGRKESKRRRKTAKDEWILCSASTSASSQINYLVGESEWKFSNLTWNIFVQTISFGVPSWGIIFVFFSSYHSTRKFVYFVKPTSVRNGMSEACYACVHIASISRAES